MGQEFFRSTQSKKIRMAHETRAIPWRRYSSLKALGTRISIIITTHTLNRMLFAPDEPNGHRGDSGLELLLVEKTAGVVGSAETKSPSQVTLSSLHEYSTSHNIIDSL